MTMCTYIPRNSRRELLANKFQEFLHSIFMCTSGKFGIWNKLNIVPIDVIDLSFISGFDKNEAEILKILRQNLTAMLPYIDGVLSCAKILQSVDCPTF